MKNREADGKDNKVFKVSILILGMLILLVIFVSFGGGANQTKNEHAPKQIDNKESNCTSQRDYDFGVKNGLKMAPPCKNQSVFNQQNQDSDEWFIIPPNLDKAIDYIAKPKCDPSDSPSDYIKSLISTGYQYKVDSRNDEYGKPVLVTVSSVRATITWVKGVNRCNTIIDDAIARIDWQKRNKFQDAERFK